MPAGDFVGDGGDARGRRAVGDAGELQVRVGGEGGLEAGDAGEDAAIDLGQDDVHGKVRRREAAFGLGPCIFGRGGEGDLEHRAAGGVERRGAGGVARGEGGGVDDRGWRVGGQRCGGPCRRAGGFQRGDEQAGGAEAFGGERGDQRINGRGIGAGQVGAVEGDDGEGLVARWRCWGGSEARRVPAAIGQRGGIGHRRGGQPGGLRECGERGVGGLRGARLAPCRQAAQGGDGERGGFVERHVWAAIGGEDGKGDVSGPRQLGKLREAIGPIARPADQADEDAACFAEGAFDVGVDR